MRNLLVIGAGGHGRVVADTAQEIGNWANISFLDDKYPSSMQVLEWNILDKMGNAKNYLNSDTEIIVAIGDNQLRVKLIEQYKQMGFILARIVHPKAFVSRYADIGEGTVVFAQTAINAGAKIGTGSIVNTGSTVDHDCLLGKGVHISPGAHLAGSVTIGDYTWVGIGASIIQQIKIGANVMIGAGSVIIRDVADHSKVVGVPGKFI